MSKPLDLDAMERRTFEVRCDTQTLIAALRKLREENAQMKAALTDANHLANKACVLLSQLTGEPWPPKPPEVG